MDYREAIGQMREKTIQWFFTMKVHELGFGVYTNSAYNKTLKNGDMYLPATYNATNCLKLLGAYDNLTKIESSEIAAFINGYQRPDGFYRMPSMKLDDLYYESFEYDNFHISNYSIAALEAVEKQPVFSFNFLKNYNSTIKLDQWLGLRDMKNPWAEGNYVVNLASFYIKMIEKGGKRTVKKYRKLIDNLFHWHESMQNSSGYWCDETDVDPVSAMAGASHNFHLYFYYNKPVPKYKNIIDHCLTLPDNSVSSACLDIDVVDILCNLSRYDYRTNDIYHFLERKLNALLTWQNEDGGFSDVDSGIRVFDGWQVYKEPQGQSNCFATWFRSASIGMISCILYPDTADQWQFRTSIGIGYFNKDYMKEGFNKNSMNDSKKRKPKRRWIGKQKNREPALDSKEKSPVTVEELAEMTCNKFNNSNLSIFKDTVTFAFKVLKEPDRIFAIEIKNCHAKITEYNPKNYNILITVSMKNLIKIIEGKLMPIMAYGLKKLAVTGDITLALKLQNLF